LFIVDFLYYCVLYVSLNTATSVIQNTIPSFTAKQVKQHRDLRSFHTGSGAARHRILWESGGAWLRTVRAAPDPVWKNLDTVCRAERHQGRRTCASQSYNDNEAKHHHAEVIIRAVSW